MNIEIREVQLVPELGDIWIPISVLAREVWSSLPAHEEQVSHVQPVGPNRGGWLSWRMGGGPGRFGPCPNS